MIKVPINITCYRNNLSGWVIETPTEDDYMIIVLEVTCLGSCRNINIKLAVESGDADLYAR